MPDVFYGDEILITSHETTFFSIFVISAKLMIFNIMKFSRRLALYTGTHHLHEWIDRLSFSRSTQNLICNDRDATQAHRTEVSRHRPAARRGGRNAGWLVPEHARRRARHGRFLIESGVTRAGRRPPGRPAEPKLKRPTKSGVANMRRPKSKLLKRLYLPQSSLMNKVNPFPDRVHDICPSSYNPRTCRIIGSEW